MQINSFVLSAPELQTEYHISLDTGRSDEAAPLLVVLDGDDQMSAAVEAARELRHEGLIPPLVLAGVGYGGGYRSPLNRRIRDYTPTHPKDEPMESGGAEAFHAFLENRLVPAISERCGFTPPSRGLTGHSLSSLFGLYALSRPAPFFDRFLVSSPSIWWDDRSILRNVIDSPAEARQHPMRAFISVGAKDTPSMTGDLTLLEKALQERPRAALEYTVERFAGRDHYDALPLAFRRGIQWLYSSEAAK